MHILVTNDDGVQARGLMVLAEAMRRLGDVSVLAPDKNWSASGHVKTMSRPLRLQKATLDDGTPALACDGAPSDCVALALLGVLDQPVDVVVSGINPYPNLGHDATYSGTVSAAMEAVLGNVPGFAFSIEPPKLPQTRRNYTLAAREAARIVETLLPETMPANTLLSTNFPTGDSYKGWQFTRQGQRIYNDALESRADPRGRPYYWIGGQAPGGVPDEGTDIGALAQGYVSITPLHLDLTRYDVLERLRKSAV
jgi:5'-nucleotidase